MSKIKSSASMKEAVNNIVQADKDMNVRIIASASDLNYFGKKLASSKLAVCEQVAEIYKEYAISVQGVENILKSAVKPKIEKSASVKKEKAPDNRPVSAGSLSHTEEMRPVMVGVRFLVTSAQNNTPVHADFLANLETYAEHIGAKIVVFPFLYNKNGFQNGEGSEEIWYDPLIVKHMQNESVWLGSGSKVAAMAYNILPTVKAPLSGMREAIGSAEAMIVPHATIAHECVPVLGAQYGRVVPALYSTGTVTQRNYINQAAGNKANNRHNFGALIVEFNEFGQFWVRQIETNESGAFQDLRNHVQSERVTEDIDITSISYGDIHAEKIDVKVAQAQWQDSTCNSSMLNYLRPQLQFCHDLLDFEALNHHNRENHYHMANMQLTGRTVADDLKDVSAILSDMDRPWCKTVVVRSNHDDALDRWLSDNKYEPRKDPANALTYYNLQVSAYTHLQKREHFDSLPVALSLATGFTYDSITFLRASQSYITNGVENGEHGHSGTNGSRGSPKQFAGSKVTTGHTHCSSIYGGCYTSGVSGKLAMGYNETGASSWVHASTVQYQTGMRAILHVKDNGNGSLDFMAR